MFWAHYCSFCTLRSFFPIWKISWSVMLMTTLMAVVSSPGVRVTIAESLFLDLGKVSEWCDLWVIKLNASKTKTMIVSRSRTMHPQSPPLTIGWLYWRSLITLLYWEWHLIPNWTLSKYLLLVSRAASQILGILRKSLRVFHDRSLRERCFRCFILPVL